MRIYVASYYDTKERIKPFVAKLKDIGHVITSSWTEEPHETDEDVGLTDGLRKYYAWRDLEEVEDAELLLLDTFDVNPRGGREFEAGYAFGLGLEVWLIGPERSIFHKYLRVRFESWPEAIRALAQDKKVQRAACGNLKLGGGR